MDRLAAALDRLPEGEREAVVAHIEALVEMAATRRAALLMLAGDGGA